MGCKAPLEGELARMRLRGLTQLDVYLKGVRTSVPWHQESKNKKIKPEVCI